MLSEEESKELAHEARVFPTADFGAPHEDTPLQQWEGAWGENMLTSDGSPPSTAARTSPAPVATAAAAWTGGGRAVGRSVTVVRGRGMEGREGR